MNLITTLRLSRRRFWFGRVYKTVTFAVVLTLVINAILPAASAFAHAPEQASTDTAPSAMSGYGQVSLPGPMGVKVNAFNGNLFFRQNSFLFPYTLPLDVGLSYNSLRRDVMSSMGYYGWQFAYDISYQLDHGSVIITHGNGRSVRFYSASNITQLSGYYGRALVDSLSTPYIAPPGVKDTLRRYEIDKFALTTPEQLVYYFDSPLHKRVTRIVHPSGQSLVFEYSSGGLLQTIYHTFGQRINFAYITLGGTPRLYSITDKAASPNQSYHFGMDGSGDLGYVIDPLGSTTDFAYGDDHQLTRITDPEGNDLDIRYAKDGFVASLTTDLTVRSFGGLSTWIEGVTASGETVRALESRETSVMDWVDGRAQSTLYVFDRRGRVNRIKNALGFERIIKWNDDDRPISIRDERGYYTHYTYDANGNVLTIVDPTSRKTSFTYHPTYNLITSITDGNNDTTHFEYDSRGNLIRRTDPNGGQHLFTYDIFGRVISDTNSVGDTFQYAYDLKSHLKSVASPDGIVQTFVNDSRGNVLSSLDANSTGTSFTYDALGRLITSTDDLGQQTSYEYDAVGNMIQVVDPAGNTSQYDYDGLGRLVRTTDPLGRSTLFDHNEQGNLTSVQDAAGRVTTLTYDLLGRLSSKTDPLGFSTSYLYDAAGNLSRRTDASGDMTLYTYDPANRPTSINYPGTAADVSYPNYDGAGNLLRQTNAAVDMDFSYDDSGNLTQMIVDVPSLPAVKTTSYTYDLAGRRQTMTDPTGGLTTYSYMPDGQIASIEAPGGRLTTYEYDPGGRLIRKNNPNGTYTDYGYDLANQLTSLANYKSDNSLISSYTYSYDAAGNIIEMVEASLGTTSYDYDALGQLLLVSYPDGRSVVYSYDAVGNRNSAVDSEHGTTTYTYDDGSRLVSQHTPTQTITYDYDNNGNLISETSGSGTTTYSYDYENHLTGIAYPGGDTTQYTMYPEVEGLRLSSGSNGSTEDFYFYDGLNLLLETDETGVVSARYTSGAGLDDWIEMERGGNSYTYHSDWLGSITGLTDESQNVASSYRYDAFGALLETSGSLVNPHGFTGRAYDSQAELYDYRARIYDPQIGRFTGPDPVSGNRFDPLTYNRYLYVLNNPVLYTDPTGEFIVTGLVLAGSIFYGLYKFNESIQPMHQSQAAYYQHARISTMRKYRNSGDWARKGYQLRKQAQRETLKAHLKGVQTGGELVQKSFSAAGFDIVDPRDYIDKIEKLKDPETVANYVADKAREKYLPDWANEGINKGKEAAGWAEKIGAALGKYWGDFLYGPDSYSDANPASPYDPNYPNRPGKDHQDDTFSAASPQFPLPGITGVSTSGTAPVYYPQSKPAALELGAEIPAYRRSPRIAVLWNGFAEEAAAFLTALGEAFDPLDPDFAPSLASGYPVLLIPSGGLYGLVNSASFQARLDGYVAQGGIVLVSAQQHGYDFSALPGGLGGYGWQEDQSCFDAAVRFPQYHQALSSFQHDSLDLLVDGYFSTFPENSVTLLERDKNGFPAALLYPHGEGYVMATTVYADWGSSNYQYSQHDYQVWRDMVAWSTLGALDGYDHTFLEFTPGEQVSVDIQMLNLSGQDAQAVRLVALDPYKVIVSQQVITTTVPAGVQTLLPYTTTAASPLGIWAVDYLLLDADGYALQDQATGAAYIVSDPAETIGANRKWDFWITSATENFVSGSVGEFTIHARNRTEDPIGNVVFKYYFPHHGAEHQPGLNSGFQPMGTVAPGEVVTHVVERKMLTNDRFFANLESDSGWSQTSFQIRLLPAGAQVEVEPEQSTYFAGQPVAATVDMTNVQKGPYTATVRLISETPDKVAFDIQERPVSFGDYGSVVSEIFDIPMPITPTFGLHTIRAEVVQENKTVGFDLAHFDLPKPQVAVTVQGPEGYQLGEDNTVVFFLENQGGTEIEAGDFNLSLKAPSGQEIWSGGSVTDIPGWSTTPVTFTIPFSTALGLYSLDHLLTLRGALLTRDSNPVAASYAVTRSGDKARYAGGEIMEVTLGVYNIGDFQEILDVRLQAPDAAYDQVYQTAPSPSENTEIFYPVELPPSITGGVHAMTVTLTTQDGVSAAKMFQYIILPANLRLTLGDAPLQAGGELPVIVTNIGGGFTEYAGQFTLRDSEGRLVTTGSTGGSIGGGEADIYGLAIPSDVQEGLYTIWANYIAYATGQRASLRRIVSINGLKASLAATTEQQVYGSGDPVTATAVITNTGSFPIDAGILSLEGVSMLGSGALSGIVQSTSEERLAGARVLLDGGQATWTNLEGEYRLENVGVGQHEFSVFRTGFQPYTETHFVAGPQEPITLTLVPLPVAELTGTVTISGGLSIVVGAEVSLGQGPDPAQPAFQHTGPDGEYRFSKLTPGLYTITATAPGFDTFSDSVNLLEGSNIFHIDLVTTSIEVLQDLAIDDTPTSMPVGAGLVPAHLDPPTSMPVGAGLVSTRQDMTLTDVQPLLVSAHPDAPSAISESIVLDLPPIDVEPTLSTAHPAEKLADIEPTLLLNLPDTSAIDFEPILSLQPVEKRSFSQDERSSSSPQPLIPSPQPLTPDPQSPATWRNFVSPKTNAVRQAPSISVSGPIITHTMWTITDSPYILTADVTVSDGVTLTIQPGVIVQGQNNGLLVLGHLSAVGLPTKTITFTSLADNAPGGWEGIIFDGGSGNLQHVVVRYGGYYSDLTTDRSNIYIRNVTEGLVSILDSSITNAGPPDPSTGSIHIASSRVWISNTLIANNGNAASNIAVYIANSPNVTITGNTFLNNAGYPLREWIGNMNNTTGNSFSGNGVNRIRFGGTSVSSDLILDKQGQLQGYEFEGPMTVFDDVALAVEPGITLINAANEPLIIQGQLQAIGTTGQPITITTSGTSWDGIYFDGGIGYLRYVTVSKGRYWNPGTGNLFGNVIVHNTTGGEVRIEESTLTGAGFGVNMSVVDGRATISNTVFSNANSGNIYHAALWGIGSNTVVTVTGSTITNNSYYGLRSESGAVVSFTGGVISDNGSYPVEIEAHNLHRVLSGNTFSGSTPNRLVVQGTLQADAVLPGDNGLEAYDLSGELIIPSGINLTVEPGAVIKGRSVGGLTVAGHLSAIGTPAKPITFTSVADSGPYQWKGLYFNGGTGHLDNVLLRYTGLGRIISSVTYYTGILARNITSGDLRIENSLFTNNMDYYWAYQDAALHLIDSNAAITNTIFSSNGNGDFAFASSVRDSAVYASGSGTNLTVTGSTFSNNNAYGLYSTSDASVSVTDSGFYTNTKNPLRTDPQNLESVFEGNTFQGNTVNRMALAAGSLPSDITFTTAQGLDGYELEGVLTVPDSIALTIEPGLTILGYKPSATNLTAYIHVLGHIEAIGTEAEPILFTSIEDTGASQWGGIGIVGGSGEFRHAIVRYSGWLPNPSYYGNITVSGGSLVVDSCQILDERSSGNMVDGGIYLHNSQAVISNTLFSGNGSTGGFGISDGAIFASGNSMLTVDGSKITNNYGNGLRLLNTAQVIIRNSSIHDNYDEVDNESSGSSDARHNWWGAAPPSAGQFSGNAIAYDPWIITDTFRAGYFDLATDTLEPNDTFANAEQVTVNETLAAFLDPHGDSDIYRVNIAEPGDLRVITGPTGTPLALEVTIYNLGQDVLASASGAGGEVLTITASVEPGLHFIEVNGDGSVAGSSSHLPYWLTFLQVDPRANLVAQTTAQGGSGYSFGSFDVQLTVGESDSISVSAPLSLTLPGGYFLWGRVSNARSQVLDESITTFFISDSPLALTMEMDQPAYRPGQTITVSGRVHNTGPDPIGPHTLTLSNDGVPFHSEPVSLPGGAAHDFSANTTALDSAGSFTITGEISSTVVVAAIQAAEPQADITLDAPDAVLPGDFRVDLVLANNGLVPISLDVDFHGQLHPTQLEPGQLAAYTRTMAVSETTGLTVQVSGDITETLVHTITFNAAPTLLLNPEDPQHEGDVEIPYSLSNPGSEDIVVDLVFDLAEAQLYKSRRASASTPFSFPVDLPTLQRQGVAWLAPAETDNDASVITHTHTLPAGETLNDTLVISLTRGLRPVEATLVVDERDNAALFSHSAAGSWSHSQELEINIRGDNDLRVSAAGSPTVTVVITNVGWNAFTGTLRTVGSRFGGAEREIFSSSEQPIHVPIEASSIFSGAVDTGELSPGPYTITLEIWADNGTLVGSTLITGTLSGPDFHISQFPGQTTLYSDQVITLTFGVENRGDSPDLASLSFSLGDLKDERQQQWMPSGETAFFSFTTYLPLDMPTQDIRGTFAVSGTHDLEGESGSILFHVQGISLTVAASTDKQGYLEGEPLEIVQHITNSGSRNTGALTSLTAFNGITRTQVFSLTPGQDIQLSFPYTATFAADRKVFYGIYGHYADRGAYLNTLYIYPTHLGATLLLDKQVYQPGEIVQATLATTLTQGVLTALVFDQSYTLTIGLDTGFSFPVPAGAERGSQAVYYVVHGCQCEADGREQAAWFDVEAPWVRVIASEPAEGPFAPGQVLSSTLIVASDATLDMEFAAWLEYPDGSLGAAQYQTVPIAASLDNRVVITAVITDTQMGLHQLLYSMATVAGGRQLQDGFTDEPADGMEGFDIGPASLDRLLVNRASYPGAGDLVRASLDIFSHQGGPAQIALALDDGPETVEGVSLAPGYQTITVTLDGPIPPGHRQLTATLTMDGLWSAEHTAFYYGTDLPDLTVGAPDYRDGLVSAMVSNIGRAESGVTSAALRLDGSLLIAQPAVPALLPGATAIITAPWDSMGYGGDHALSAVVDEGQMVVESDESNNASQRPLSIPRLLLTTETDDAIYLVGEEVSITAHLTNRAPSSFGVVLTTTISGPDGQVVYSDTRPVSLTPGSNEEVITWPTIGHPVGVYALRQRATEASGPVLQAYTTFELSLSAPQASFLHNSPVTLGDTSVFTNTTAGGGTLSFQWNFGDGSPIVTETHPVHVFASVGSYSVVLTATNEGGLHVYSDQHNIVPAAPQAGFTSNSPVVIGNLSVFTNTTTGGGNLSYLWNFGDGSPLSTDTNPSHTYGSAGDYTVILTATNEGGSSAISDLHQIVPEAPQAGFTSNSPVTLGSTSWFTNTTTGASPLAYQWNFGDGSPVSTTENPSHVYSAVGVYTVILTATNAGGYDVISGLHEVVEESGYATFLPFLVKPASRTSTELRAGEGKNLSCAGSTSGLLSALAELAGAVGLAKPREDSCSVGIVGLSGLSLPWLLLLGTTFIYRRRKRG